MAIYEVKALPAAPLAAAAQFYAKHLPIIELVLIASDDALILAFPSADHTHRNWRLAAVQELAREHAPRRINAIAGDAGGAILAAVAYLDAADGVTGQYLMVDGAGAGPVLS